MLKINKIVWPTDFSEPSYEALHTAVKVADHFQSELVCVHIMEPTPTTSEWADASNLSVPLSLQEEEARLVKALEDIAADRVPKTLKQRLIVEIGDLPHGLFKVVERESADLIVIATHGRKGWRRMVFGSVAEAVIRDAECPVLTIKPAHDEAAQADD